MDQLKNRAQVTENMISKLKDRLTEFTISEKQIQRGVLKKASQDLPDNNKMSFAPSGSRKGGEKQWD